MALSLHPEQKVILMQIGMLISYSFSKHIVTSLGDNSPRCTEKSLEDLCAFEQRSRPIAA